MFSVGDKVVFVGREHSSCPNKEAHERRIKQLGPVGLVRGRVYTLVEVNPGCPCGIGLHLAEIQARSPQGFCPYVFRKVKKADGDFEALLASFKPQKTKEVHNA